MPLSWIKEELSALSKEHLLRTLLPIETEDGVYTKIHGEKKIIFCSNDYLGLSVHPKVKKALTDAAKRWGMGQRASRLVCGQHPLYEELEKEIAEMKHTPSALIFPTGYMAALGFVSSFLSPKDTVILDKLSHASLIDAARLCGAKMRIFPHKDVDYLEKILKKSSGKKLIITDGVFSMDGDIAPLPELFTLCKMYEAYLFLDDAHATGTMGKGGGGTLSHFGLSPSPSLIQMGTLSKACGALGGFIAAEECIIEYLKNKARPFIYTTALPAPILSAALVAIKLLKKGEGRKELDENASLFREGLRKMGLFESPTHIFPLIIGDEKTCIDFSTSLLKEGIYTPPIRYPTVKKGEARLRFSITALHKKEDIETALSCIEKVRRIYERCIRYSN